MNVLNDLMPKTSDHARRKHEILALQAKWQRTGLLEGLSDYDKGAVSQLLENQAKQLLREANRTSTTAGSEEWSGIALPLVRRIFSDITAKDFVSVQPMNLPTGLVFWLEFKYGTGQAGFTTNSGHSSQNDSLMGVTDATKGTTVAEGGLYGAGRFGYTINDYSSSVLTATGSTPTATTASVGVVNFTTDINFDTEFSASYKSSTLLRINVASSSLTNPDFLGARAFTVTGTGINDIYPQFTTVASNNSYISFIVSCSTAASSSGIADLKAFYHKQPTATWRGDFEELKTQEDPLDIPELNIEFYQESITAKERKLKAQWTPEFAQDIQAFQNIDAEAELTSVLGDYISREIDLEILDMLIKSAQTIDYWSARLGYEYNSSARAFTSVPTNAAAYTQGTWFQTVGTKIQKMSNEIHSLTMRGGANFIVTSPKVATILESIPGYAADTDGSQDKFSMGSQKMGTINNRFTVYKIPYMRENLMLLGYQGANYLESGAVYAPYIPLLMTPTVLDPDNFTPRKGVMTRYAKKLMRPEFYGKIYIEGLDSI